MTIKALNTAPYYDDFDPAKNFHRILYRPGFPVQARELTQQQTIVQDQIKRFGENVFRQGSMINGGTFDIERDIDTVEIETTETVDSLNRVAINGVASQVKAFVTHAVAKGNNVLLFLRYKNSTSTDSVFRDGEDLEYTDTATAAGSTIASNATGKGALFSIESGIIFFNGFFVNFPAQKVVLSETEGQPTAQAYFQSQFYTVDSEDDSSLLDNAQGAPTFSAPGADRLKAEMNLAVGLIDESLGEDQIALLKIRNGDVLLRNDQTQYNAIMDELAKRKFDESGNFIVEGLDVFTREHLDTGVNEGRFSSSNGGDSTLLSVGVEPGLAYVKGYDVQNPGTTYVDIPKATDYKNVQNQLSFVRSGNYLLVDEFSGVPELNEGDLINLYDTAEQRYTNFEDYNVAPTGTQIGTAKVKNLLTENKTQVRVYLMDIRVDSGYNQSDISAIGNATMFGDVVPDQTGAIVRDQLNDSLIFTTGDSFIRTLYDETGTIQTSFVYSESSSITIDSNGEFTVNASGNETFPYGTGQLQSLAKESLIVTIETNTTISHSGTISSSGTTVTGSGTVFTTTLNPGDRLITSGNDRMIIESVVSDTELTIDRSLTFSDLSFSKEFITGDEIPLNAWGSDAAERTVSATDTSLSFNLEESFGASAPIAGKVVYNISQSNVQEATKEIRPNRIVLFDTSTLSDLSKLNIGAADVMRVRQVRKHTSQFTDISDGVDVTNQFRLDNGQRDSIYGHASLIPQKNVGASEFYLVEFDYFVSDFSTGFGYFSVDSYPIDDSATSPTTIQTFEIPTYRPTNGEDVISLRNVLDFRPIKEATIVDTTNVGTATVNPTTTQNLVYGSNGLGVPVPGTNLAFDFSFYLSRHDLVVANEKGEFDVVQGKPSTEPQFPKVTDDVMVIAELIIPPFPSISSTYARVLGKTYVSVNSNKVGHQGYSMEDIHRLNKRLEVLEYYNALNQLEKSSFDQLITDENGLDRFKNGVFVEGFHDQSLGARGNPDYNIAINANTQEAIPVVENDDSYLIPATKTNVVENKGVITLPFNEEVMIDQNRVTTFRNIEQSVFRFVGEMQLDPEIDHWVDTSTSDEEFFVNTSTGEIRSDNTWSPELVSSSTESEALYTTTSFERVGDAVEKQKGFSVYNRQYGDRSQGIKSTDKKIGEFSTMALALDAARSAGFRGGGRTKISTNGTATQTTTSRITNTSKIKSFEQQSSKSIGNFVTDISLKNYIRPQKIQVYCTGLKANTQFFMFFDNEEMSDYVTVLDMPSQGSISDATKAGPEGSTIRSNEFGELLLQLRLPETGKRFRTGEKKIRVTDSPTDSKDRSSYAENTFVAQGLRQKKQNTTFSTGKVVTRTKVDTRLSRSSSEVQAVKIVGPSCMAYTFLVDAPDGEKGVFLTSADVFIQSLHPELGVWFEIREMSNDGGIKRDWLPYSQVWMPRSDSRLKTSNDASVPTNVDFEAPVFLYNDTQYAFVIHTEGLNPDTYFFISRLGEEDINTGDQINERQLTGTTYTTNNNLNWDVVPDVDLTVKFYRADFDNSANGTVVFKNKNYEYIKINDREIPFTVSDDITGSEHLQLINVTGTAVPLETDIVIGSSSGASATIVNQSGNDSYTDGFGFTEGENVTFTNSNGDVKDVAAVIGTLLSGSAVVKSKPYRHNKLVLSDSNGEFFVDCVLKNDDGDTLILTEFDEMNHSKIHFDSNSLSFSNSDINFRYRSREYSTGTFANWEVLDTDKNFRLDTERTLLSASNEQSSIEMEASVSSPSTYVSPVIDTNVVTTVLTRNIINNDTTDEDRPTGGNLINKYISSTVTLADGQEAEDMKVYSTIYRPQGTDVVIWGKFLNGDDGDVFEDKDWIQLDHSTDVFSSKSDLGDFFEIEYNIPDTYKDSNGVFTYTKDGQQLTTYKKFAVKVGLLSNNTHDVPRVSDVRAIALQL